MSPSLCRKSKKQRRVRLVVRLSSEGITRHCTLRAQAIIVFHTVLKFEKSNTSKTISRKNANSQ